MKRIVGLFFALLLCATFVPTVGYGATSAKTTQAQPLTTITGRLLDIQRGLVFFSSGNAYRLAPDASILDVASGKPFIGDNVTGDYGQAGFAADGSIHRLLIGTHSLPLNNESSVKNFAVALTGPKPNPELTGEEGFSGQPVLVTFTVQVPPTTSFTDSIYLSTEASGWDAMAIRMDRIDVLHYRITRRLASGTRFVYRYTRGSWRSAERGRNGLEEAPRTYLVRNLDVARRDDTVAHWSDENTTGTTPVTPDAIPTPFNGRPFSIGS